MFIPPARCVFINPNKILRCSQLTVTVLPLEKVRADYSLRLQLKQKPLTIEMCLNGKAKIDLTSDYTNTDSQQHKWASILAPTVFHQIRAFLNL